MKTLVCFISHYLLQIVEGGYWTRSTFLLLQPQIAYTVALIYVPYTLVLPFAQFHEEFSSYVQHKSYATFHTIVPKTFIDTHNH